MEYLLHDLSNKAFFLLARMEGTQYNNNKKPIHVEMDR